MTGSRRLTKNYRQVLVCQRARSRRSRVESDRRIPNEKGGPGVRRANCSDYDHEMTSAPESPTKSPFEEGEYDWIEKAGIENLKQRIASADILAKEAASTLTVLLAGAGGSWAYAAKLLDEAATRGGVAAFFAGTWLTVLAAMLVMSCMRIGPIPAVYNQPGQLLRRASSGETFEQWRVGELENIEARIKQITARNDATARRLNRIRIFATLTPVLAGLGVLIYDRC